MCGIVGILNKKEDAIKMALDGLSSLEYRGYDSAGIAYQKDESIITVKTKGRVQKLKEKIDKNEKSLLAIAHTRWATHGEANDRNAHPHTIGDITIVHNGIIENEQELKEELKKYYTFQSDTDTEVACAFLDFYYQKTNSMIDTITKFMDTIKGSYAILILCKKEPDTIYAIKKDSPLIIAINEESKLIASDVPAILKYSKNYYVLEDMEWAKITKNDISFYQKSKKIEKEINTFEGSNLSSDKGCYPHYMLKEMMEEKESLEKTILPYLTNLDLLTDVSKYKKIEIVACGSAYHAGLIGKYLLEEKANIETHVELASEYRYKHLFLDSDSLVIFISQSGETADTLAALKKVKKQGIKTLGIINVKESSIARYVDDVLYTEAGCEIAVATTKAYVTQVALLSLLALKAAKKKKLLKEEEVKKILEEFYQLPRQVNDLLQEKESSKKIARMLTKEKDIFYLGRGLDSYVMMEGSLKLKEITYLHSECYSAGELKHGSISLIEKGSKIFIGATTELNDKTISNAKEVIARGGEIILITNDDTLLQKERKERILIPITSSFVSPILEVIPLQMIAYYLGCYLKRDIDKPRNLAKSVTVE